MHNIKKLLLILLSLMCKGDGTNLEPF